MTSDESELPRLWSVEVAHRVDAVEIEPHMRPHDYICLWRKRTFRGIARVDKVNSHGARRMNLHVELLDTVLLDDTLEHYRLVLDKIAALSTRISVHLVMRPIDKTIERVYGALDPLWYSVTTTFFIQQRTAYDRWSSWLKIVSGRNDRGYELRAINHGSKIGLSNLAEMRIREHSLWNNGIRSIRINIATNPAEDSDGWLHTKLFVLTKQIMQLVMCKLLAQRGRRWHIYSLRESDAQFIYEQLCAALSPERVSLSRPGYLHTARYDEDHDGTAEGIEHRHESRMTAKLPYLRWSCCSAALALSSMDLPVYVVLWITYWLPGMYRLKTELERLRLIEGIYASRKKVLAARDVRNNKQRI